MNPGDEVEVNVVWAAQGRLLPPLKSWSRGYTFVRTEGDVIVVRHMRGLYKGIVANYPASDVRPVSTS